MKVLVKLLTLCLVVSVIAGCGDTPTEAPTTDLTAAEQWAQANGVGPWTPEEEDWEAIEAAALEEGRVVVYSNSSKIEKLIEPFEAMYPGIMLDGADTDDIHIKMSAEQEAGNIVGDVWFQSFGHILYGEFMPNQWLWSYVPPGVEFHWPVTEDRPYALQRRSVDLIGYNQEIYPDGCPLTSWWELTEPELKGKFYMEDPISDSSTTAKITLIVQYADEFAEAYQDLYGKDWTLMRCMVMTPPMRGTCISKSWPRISPASSLAAMRSMRPLPLWAWTRRSSPDTAGPVCRAMRTPWTVSLPWRPAMVSSPEQAS